MTYRFITILTIMAALGACSQKSSENKPAEKPQGVISDAQKKTMEDAKKTEEVLKEANDKRMKEVDEQ